MYKVLRRFEDLQDNRYLYQPGDQFPRAGLKVSKDRLEELCTSKNRRRVPLIKFEEDLQKEVKSVEPEVDEEIIEKIEEAAETSTEAPVEEAAEPEHVENATEAALEEPEQTEVIESKPKRKRAKKEQ